MDYIETNNSINEKSNYSSEIHFPTKNNNKIFPQQKEYDINLATIKKLKAKKAFNLPSNLKRTFKFTIVLTIIGIILIFCGILKAILNHNVFEGLMFWVLALLVLIPGGFYSFQFYKAKKAKTEIERNEILDKIPKLNKIVLF